MENTAYRSKYSRSNAYYRKRRANVRNVRAKSNIREIIAKQLVISIFIFLILLANKSINTTATNYISGKIKWALQQDIDVSKLPGKINVFIDNIINGPLWQGEMYKENNLSKDDNLNSLIDGDNQQSAKVNNADFDSSSQTKNINGNIKEGLSENEKVEFITPVEGKISSPFGLRVDPITQKDRFHYGLDIETEKGALIKAAAGGLVLEVSEEKLYGKNIKLKHKDGTITVYAHCETVFAEEGTWVEQGTAIAEVGNTGYSTGTHLHFEIWRNSEALDPELFIDVSQNE